MRRRKVNHKVLRRQQYEAENIIKGEGIPAMAGFNLAVQLRKNFKPQLAEFFEKDMIEKLNLNKQ